MAFDPDKYLSEAPAAAPAPLGAGGFDPDAYLAAQPSVPLPQRRPEEAPSMTPAIAAAPLPMERPAEAPPRETPSAFAPSAISPEQAAAGQPLYDELASVGRSFKRGVHAARQGFEAVSGAAASRPLSNLNEIERRIAAGEKPEDIPDREDVLGARFMTPEKRAEIRAELEGTKAEAAKGIAARQADIQQYPVPPEVEKVANAKTFREGWEAFKEAPLKVIAHLGAESLPQSAPGLIGGMVAGPIGGLAAAGGMAGFGSYATDYASEIIDGLRDAKVDLKDPKAVEAAMADSELMKRIGAKAHAHAVPVAAFDAISAGTAAHSLLPKGLTPSNVVAKQLVEIPAKAPVQAALDMTGEATGQQFAGDEFKPGAILAEGLGGLSQTPGEVATAAFAKPAEAAGPRRVIVDTPANAADVAAAVAAGGIAVDPAEVHGPPEMYGPPKPTNQPVTTAVNGVETTSITEGVADAYTMIFGPEGKPQMAPTMAPAVATPDVTEPSAPAAFEPGPLTQEDMAQAQFATAVFDEATKLFPDIMGEISPQAMAFENGAHGYAWDMGMPPGVAQTEVAMAYSSGAAFAMMNGPQAQAAQRVVPEWTQGGSEADSAALSAAYVVPTHEVTRRPLTANPETNPEWTKGQENTVPGPRSSYTELSVQTPTAEGLVTMPITTRESVNGSPVALVEGQALVPSEIGFFRAALWALRGGIRRIAWTGGYAPSARKLARRLGGTMGSTRVPINRPAVMQVGSTMDPMTRMLVPLWGVIDPATGQSFVTTPDRVAAEEAAEKNTTYSEVPAVTLPRGAYDVVRVGQPYTVETFSNSQGAAVGSSGSANPLSKAVVDPLVGALNTLIKRLNLGISVKVIVHDGPIRYMQYNHTTQQMEEHISQSLGTARSLGKTPQTKLKAYSDIVAGEIHVSLASPEHNNAESLWATMVHELGHLIMNTIYQKASNAVRTAVHAAYLETYFKKMKLTMTMEEVYALQSNAAFMVERVMSGAQSTKTLGSLTQEQVDYWVGFVEWYAEQVAKWGTTSEKPLAVVEKFFAGTAKRLMAMLKIASDMFGMHYEPVPALKAFLDSAIESDTMKLMGPQVHVQTEHETTLKNAAQMEAEDAAVEAQVETQAGMDGINGAFNGRPPKEAQQAKAYADKFNWLWKHFTGIHQLAAANRHIKALAEYVDVVRAAQQVKQQIKIRSDEVLRKWTRLGELQTDAVSKLLDEVQHMTYLTNDEKKRKVSRHPTLAELTALAQKHKVTSAGLAVYGEVGKSFQEFLGRLEDVLTKDAMKMSDTIQRDLKLAGITKHMAALRNKPYFPSMRFGNYTLTIRNAAKSVIHFETFETERQRRSAMGAIQAQYGVPNEQMVIGFLDKTVRPLLGVPTQLLDMMGEKLELSAIQRDQLEQLKFELSPAESFRHRFQHKKLTAGYSMDFRRAYAKYFFHGANHLMKAQYADRMRALTKMAKTEATPDPATGLLDITKREKIVAYMTNHTDAWLSPKSDWAALSGVAFHFHLGWSAAAATQNLSQTLLTSHPFLGAKFGRISATAALVKAARGLENFYRKRTLEKHSNFAQKALFQGMEEGVIKETQAVELAGYADGGLLGAGFGGNKIQRAIVKFNEWGAFMFEMSEQFNRRVVFRATLDLAMKNPGAKYVREAVARNNLIYQARRAEQWTEEQAAAYVAAVDAVKETQFEYGKEFAAPVARGKARSLLVFKTFQQSYFMFLLNNSDARIHSLLVLGFLGGLMGVPLAEELKQLLKIIGWMAFGKDWDIEHEARKHILELLGDKAGDVAADLMLHGAAKRGFGMHDAGDMLAPTMGVENPVPMFDRSKVVAFGGFLPIEFDKFFGPPLQTTEKAIAQQAQRASGAIFGVGFAAYNALRDSQLSWSDAKRWEGLMPRAIRNVSAATRGAVSGGERTKTGGKIIEYDPRDPQGAAELIGMGMGYSPYRKNYEWEKAMSKHDAAKMIDIQRTQIMGQFGNAVLGKDPDERAKMTQAVRDFNANLQPEERGKAITSDSLRKSVETKARDRALQERGLPTKKSDVGIYRKEDELYPGQNRTVRPVPSALKP